MALTSGPNLGLLENAALGEAHYAEQTRLLRGLDGLVQARVISRALTAPPGSPANGDCHIPAIGATGAWSPHVNKFVRWSSFTTTWEAFTPRSGWRIWDLATSRSCVYNGTVWVEVLPGGVLAQNLQNANYTFALADVGGEVIKDNTTAYTWTIPPNSSVAFPIGTMITVRAKSGTGAVTLARGSGVTLRKAGVGTDANLTLAVWGLATLKKEGTNEWVATGTGI